MLGRIRPQSFRILTLALCMLFSLELAADLSAQVNVRVITDRAILPIAELASTQTDPDVIVLSNGVVEVTLVPNRGRVVAELRTADGTDFVAFIDKPDPFRGPEGVEIVEFGGFYSSIPWNSRVRQPYNLEYEIVARGPERAEVVITGLDILTRVSVEWHVILDDDSDTVLFDATYTNESSRSTTSVDVEHLLHLRYGQGRFDRRYLVSQTDGVTVVSSDDDWLGSEGTMVSIDAVNHGWPDGGDFCVVGSVDPGGDGIAWFQRRGRSALVWDWDSRGGFSSMRLCATEEFFQLTLTGETWTLEPGSTRTVSQRLAIVDGLPRNPKLSEIRR